MAEDNKPAVVEESKSIFVSRIFWVNIISLVGAFLTTQYGIEVDPEAQAQIVTGILTVVNVANIILRQRTKTSVYVVKKKEVKDENSA